MWRVRHRFSWPTSSFFGPPLFAACVEVGCRTLLQPPTRIPVSSWEVLSNAFTAGFAVRLLRPVRPLALPLGQCLEAVFTRREPVGGAEGAGEVGSAGHAPAGGDDVYRRGTQRGVGQVRAGA